MGDHPGLVLKHWITMNEPFGYHVMKKKGDPEEAEKKKKIARKAER